ncbi:uncharacterized protein LOC143294223 [Babylonia areolata]|uniref:uncharacterized protein LOC143294223 n=1 Tax=Babylonia areolata TaxID=304850 RepID=UPI003FD2C70E
MAKPELLIWLAGVTVAITTARAAAGTDKGICVNIVESSVRCYVDLDLPMTWMDGVAQDVNVVMRAVTLTAVDPLVQCGEPDKYKEAMACVIDVLEKCSHPADTIQRLPDKSRMLQGMDLICSKYYSADTQCMKDQDRGILDCGLEITRDLLVHLEPSVLTNTPIVCLAYEVHYDCTETFLRRACDPLTAEAFTEMVRRYALPRVCTSPEMDPGREDRVRHVSSSSSKPGAPRSHAAPTLPACHVILLTSLLSASLVVEG